MISYPFGIYVFQDFDGRYVTDKRNYGWGRQRPMPPMPDLEGLTDEEKSEAIAKQIKELRRRVEKR